MPDDDDPDHPVDPCDIGAVADVLYRVPPDEFIARRSEFVKAARAAGDRDAAKRVQGFGRPTRAAWVLNLLARDAPEVVGQLVELGAGLAAAQRDLDATTLRELSDQRRALVREVSKQAFGLAGENSPSTALVTEVQDTLTAAVVDASVGEALRAGALLKAAQASGFGPAGPELASVPAPRALTSVPKRKAAELPAKAAAGTRTAGRKAAARTAPSAAERKAQAAAEREAEKARRAAEQQAAQKRARIAAADRALAQAREARETARAAETEAQEQVRIRREQLRDADRALGDAGLAVREARAAVRVAEKARRESG